MNASACTKISGGESFGGDGGGGGARGKNMLACSLCAACHPGDVLRICVELGVLLAVPDGIVKDGALVVAAYLDVDVGPGGPTFE